MGKKNWFHDEPFNAFWEQGYRNLAISCMGGPSLEVIEMSRFLPSDAKVLDLGCGEGRNALYLATLGYSVTAVDRSLAGIAKLRTMALQLKIDLKTVVADIREYLLEYKYDLVMAHGVLYYLKNIEWRSLLNRVKAATVPGGFNIFTLFIYDDSHPCTEEIQAAHYQSSFSPKEIQRFYEEWEEVRFDQYIKWDSHPGIPIHCHPIEKLVARKPDGSPINIVSTKIESMMQLPDNVFQKIEIGATKNKVIDLIGISDQILSFTAEGVQFNMSVHDENPESELRRSMVNGYILELFFYQKFVVYFTNGVVSGKARFVSDPIRIAAGELI